MKKLTYTSAILMAMMATSVYAHHPAEAVVDPEIYDKIEENLADSPHATMDLYTMGSAAGLDMGSSAMEQAATEQTGPFSDQTGVVPNIDPPMDDPAELDTFRLVED